MKIEKPSNEELVSQIRIGKVLYWTCGILTIILLAIGLWKRDPVIVIGSTMFWISSLHIKEQEMHDKIRLEIRDLKK